MLVVDTSVFKVKRDPVLVPAHVAWELCNGAESARDRADVEALPSALETDLFTDAIARLAGGLHVQFRRDGNERPAWDLPTAAHAFHH